ncbi:MAG: hypothetical protein J6Z00_00130 [Clostridia bacterium]|nr:hypothetical protein [Clostridia bacterium]
MKKILSVFFLCSLLSCMLSIFTISVSADNADSPVIGSYIAYFDEDSTQAHYIYKNKIAVDFEGMHYNRITNKLTIKNAYHPFGYLVCAGMGKSFKIVVVGKNAFSHIESTGYLELGRKLTRPYHNASLTVTGFGTLRLNEVRLYQKQALCVYAKGTPSTLAVDPSVKLYTYAAKSVYDTISPSDPYFSIAVKETTLLNGVLSLPTAPENTHFFFDYFDYDAEGNYVDLYTFSHPIDYTQSGTQLVSENGNLVCYMSGKKTDRTFLYRDSSNQLNYIKNGVVTKDTLLFKHTDNKWYFIKDGIVDTSATLLFKHNDGKYYYIRNGVVTKNTLLYKYTDGKYYYVKNGVVTKATLLFKHTDGKYYYVKNGVVTKDTLLFKATNKTWYYIKNGIKTNATLLVKHKDGKYYYVKDGTVTKDTLLFKHTDGKYYYIKNGVVTKQTLLFKHKDNKYYFVKNGIVTKATLLFKHSDKKFYYVKNGMVTKDTLLAKHTDGKTYYVKKGVVFKSSLIFPFKGKHYYIKNGIW